MCQKPLEHSTGADQAEVKEREEQGRETEGVKEIEGGRKREERRRNKAEGERQHQRICSLARCEISTVAPQLLGLTQFSALSLYPTVWSLRTTQSTKCTEN